MELWKLLITTWVFLFILLFAVNTVMEWIDISKQYKAILKELEQINENVSELKNDIIRIDDGK